MTMRGSIWRHKKRGATYEILHDNAFMQCASAQEFEDMFEDDWWIVYRNLQTGTVYVRPYEEFRDGRFERVDGEQAEQAADEIERLCAGIKDALDLLSDGPGGPRRISAMKLLDGLVRK